MIYSLSRLEGMWMNLLAWLGRWLLSGCPFRASHRWKVAAGSEPRLKIPLTCQKMRQTFPPRHTDHCGMCLFISPFLFPSTVILPHLCSLKHMFFIFFWLLELIKKCMYVENISNIIVVSLTQKAVEKSCPSCHSCYKHDPILLLRKVNMAPVSAHMLKLLLLFVVVREK